MKVADGRIDSAAYPLFAAADSLGIMELGICYFSDVPDQLNFIGRDSARVFYVHIGLGSVMWELRDAEISIDPNRMATGLRIFHEFKIPHPYIVIDESKLQLTAELYKIVYEVNLIQYLSKETLKKINELYEKEYTAIFELNAKAVEEFLKRNKEVDYVVIQDKIYFVSEKLTREGKTVYELLGTIDIDKVGWASRPAVLTDDAVKMLVKALPRKNTTIHVSFGNAEFVLVEVTIKNVDAVMRIFVKEIPISEYREKVIGFLASEAHMPVYTEEEIEMKKKAMEAARKRVEEERKREEKPPEKPPEQPPEKPLERPPSEVERLYEEAVREKLRFYTRMKLLEAGVPLGVIEGMMRMLLDNVELLAEDVIAKVISQKDAERRIDELVKSIAETIRRRKLRREDIVRRLENEYLSFLREQGVRNVRQVLEAVREDIESLVDEVVAGRMSLDEALRRVREIPLPPIAQLPKVAAPPTPEAAIPEVTPHIETIETESDILELLGRDWEEIVTKGLYNYLTERGTTPTKKTVGLFVRAAWRVLSTRKPTTVREWFITYCPIARKVIEMLLSFGVESENFKEWFEDVYNYFRPTIERESGIQLPPYEEFYEIFKDFIIGYHLV